MVPDADEKGHSQRRHPKNRRKHTANVGQLMLAGQMSTETVLRILRAAPEFSFLERWGCPIPELVFEPRGSEILRRMYKLWRRLTADQRRMYLQTAERIAEAEKAKSTWNPKASRERSIYLAKSAVAAARLVRELSLIFPPPWLGDENKLGELVFGLASYIRGTLDATVPWERDEAVDAASGVLRTAKKRIARRTGGMRWELLRDLVWLASGKMRDLDERDVRRYLDKQRSAKNLAEGYLRPNWELMGSACLLAKQWRAQPKEPDKPKPSSLYGQLGGPSLDSESHTKAALRYLASPRASSVSP
jgi:hypothetical protein